MIFNPNGTRSRSAAREIAFLQTLHHENITTHICSTLGEYDATLVTEYMDMDLKMFIELPIFSKSGGIHVHVVKHIVRQILKGVEYCHWMNVMHRDLKPANLLIDRHLHLKICDFGLGISMGQFQTDGLDRVVGTRFYVAPDVLLGNHTPHMGIDI